MRPYLCLLSELGRRNWLSPDAEYEKGDETLGRDYVKAFPILREVTELLKGANLTEYRREMRFFGSLNAQPQGRCYLQERAGTTWQRYVPGAKGA